MDNQVMLRDRVIELINLYRESQRSFINGNFDDGFNESDMKDWAEELIEAYLKLEANLSYWDSVVEKESGE